MASRRDQKLADFKLDKTGGAQMHGLLLKKPVGHKSTVWQKRFFVLKESFLMYYPETEKKVFTDKKIFNIHPKGIIPLGYCNIEETPLPGINYGITINFPDNSNAICLGADDIDTRARWIDALEVAAKVRVLVTIQCEKVNFSSKDVFLFDASNHKTLWIKIKRMVSALHRPRTLENCSLGEAMIKSLQEQGLQLARENEEIYTKYCQEAKDAGSERERREEVEEFNQQIIEEKLRIKAMVEELQSTQSVIKRELDEAMRTYRTLEVERQEMTSTNDALHTSLRQISADREAISQLLDSSKQTNEDASLLRHQLAELTEATVKIEKEKYAVDERLQKNEMKMQEYLNEKQEMHANVDTLKSEIEELNNEKENVETKLKEEMIASRELQDHLSECREALQRLEHELIVSRSREREAGDEWTNQISADVHSLKKFFEKFASEDHFPEVIPARRCSRRYTQIKKLRHSDESVPRVAAQPVARERLSSTPGSKNDVGSN